MQCPLQRFPKLVIEPNGACLLLAPLLSPLIWLAEMLSLLRKKNHFYFLAVFQDPAQLANTIVWCVCVVCVCVGVTCVV